MKILIVGCGYSGSFLNYFLVKKGVTVHIADRGESVTSTKVSAGIMIPVTGRRIVKTYNADKIIPFAQQTYRDIEAESGHLFFNQKDILQLFTSPGNMNEWYAASDDPGIKKYTGAILRKEEINSTIVNEHGGILLQRSGAVDPVVFVNAVKTLTAGQSEYFSTSLDYQEVEFLSNGINWKDQFYDFIIFCEGFETTLNPWFGYIPFKPAKGEILDFYSGELDDQYIINGPVFILPEGNGHFRAGSTYNWDDLTTSITTNARQTLEDGIRKTINCKYEITGHKAGIRPAIKDRRPVIGFHKKLKQVGIFNGLGTKGAMLAPYYAKQFSELITEGKLQDADVDIRRFDSLFQGP